MTTTVRKAINRLPIVLGSLVAANLIAAWEFSVLENVGYGDSLYWSWITSLSVGYGDISPATTGGKIVAVALGMFVLYVITPLVVGIFVTTALENKNEFTHREQEEIKQELDQIIHLLSEKEEK